jgi:hypothetical protein
MSKKIILTEAQFRNYLRIQLKENTKKVINEEINYKVVRTNTKDKTPIAYIDPKTSENVYDFKDIIKKYGGKWDKYTNRWFWWLSNDPQEREKILQTQVNPAIEELTYLETPQNGEESRRNPSDIQDKVAKMVKELDKILATPSKSQSEEDIKSKIKSFKEKIVNITSSEEFKRVMGPIIKFKQALGHQYSFGNIILIYCQDPSATMVKSKSRWAKLNRVVKEGSPVIYLWTPYGMEPFSKEEKEEKTLRFLALNNVRKVEELTPGQKEELDVILSGTKPKGFDLKPNYYDHRFTEPIKGKEDLAPKVNMDNIEWFDNKTEATEKTIALYDAAIESIKSVGINVNYVDDLGGARGVSKNGTIDVLTSNTKNIGDFGTLVHEFSHELLHQKYLKTKDEGNFGEFFVGTQQGRAQVEQQAELSAWIICQYFGYEMPTSVNYMGCWGMDEKSASKVFDTVAGTATRIIDMISKNMQNTLKEGFETNGSIITGEKLANMLGLGKLYRKSKEMLRSINPLNQRMERPMVAENVLKEQQELEFNTWLKRMK